jgi:hypothetical protein
MQNELDANIVTRTAAGTCTTCGGTTAHWLPTHRTAAAEPRTLCYAEGTRGRVCAADKDHDGNHNWVPRTVRED